MKRPIRIYFLSVILFLVSLNALVSGFSFMIDPSGSLIKFPENYLRDTFFRNYFIPGIFLFFIIGFMPLFLLYGLLDKNSLKFLNRFKVYRSESWQFNFLIYYGFTLLIWINVQVIFIPYFFLQSIISFIGILVIFISLFDSTRKYF